MASQRETPRKIVKRHDLNADGRPIRRLFYRNSLLARREYHDREGIHQSTEYFDTDGYITESVRYEMRGESQTERTHWWYENGMPEKLIGSEGHNEFTKTKDLYVRDGENWVKEE